MPDSIGQGDALIRYWLRMEPADDLEKWRGQLAQAAWLEKRLFTALAKTIHGSRRDSGA